MMHVRTEQEFRDALAECKARVAALQEIVDELLALNDEKAPIKMDYAEFTRRRAAMLKLARRLAKVPP
jgi:alkylation response protein AidB-like acyl-CoA dehydrogenase